MYFTILFTSLYKKFECIVIVVIYSLNCSSLTLVTIVRSDESESQIDAVSSWSKPCLQVELENEDPISAKSLKVSGGNKSSQINIYSHFCLWFNMSF